MQYSLPQNNKKCYSHLRKIELIGTAYAWRNPRGFRPL